MVDISMADVRLLRERLGVGVMDSRNALIEAGGDIERAVEILRLKGLKSAEKREGRSVSEGLVVSRQFATHAVLAELCCETDFVAKSDRFLALSEKVADLVSDADSLETALRVRCDEGSVADLIALEAAVLGENVALRRFARVEGSRFSVYMHRTSSDLPPQVGVILAYEGHDDATARFIAQHIAFAAPEYLSVGDIPQGILQRERDLLTEISRGEGKPEEVLPQIVEGRLVKLYKQNALLEQDYVRDNKVTISKVLEATGLRVISFARFRVGT
ncbi:translation elongation factor Ts [Tropheryma whipplei]|uniref:translation elongation factor Ts n=1 Tax=Tropheryma whipplei TaxID=2039 RepID=UPI0004AFA4EA|nr:translation elongation factor Ts [Tropheryma whipplei]